MASFWHKAAAESRGPFETVAKGEVIQGSFAPGAKPRASIRREPPPLSAALVPTDDPLRLRLAEELEYARRMLGIMGDELAGDGAVVVRHGRALQSVDIVSQLLGHLASVIRSSDPGGAVERIGMAELKARLMRKSMLSTKTRSSRALQRRLRRRSGQASSGDVSRLRSTRTDIAF
jgi:hypothetical protein